MKLRREKKQDIIISIVLAILVLLSILAIFVFINKTTQMKLNELTYQYHHNQRYEFDKDTLLKISENGTLQLVVNGKQIDVDASPLYMSEKSQMYATVDSILVNYETALQLPVPNSTKYILENNVAYAEGRNVDVTNCFIFDGRNTYTLLSDMILTIYDESFILNTFSFIEVDPTNDFIRVYDYKKQEMSVHNFNDAGITLSDVNEQCEIDLFYDSLKAIQGQDILLFTDPKSIEGR